MIVHEYDLILSQAVSPSVFVIVVQSSPESTAPSMKAPITKPMTAPINAQIKAIEIIINRIST